MKQTWWILSLLLGGVLMAQSTSTLRPIGEAQELELAQSAILIPANAQPTELTAAQLLQKTLHDIFQVNVPVIAEPESPADGSVVLAVGNTEFGREARQTGALGDAGYALEFFDGNLLLYGGRRNGPINAVLALLEEDLDCRWPARDMAGVIPRRSGTTLGVVPRRYRPQLEIRDPFFIEGFEPQWCAMNRTNPFILGDVPPDFGGRIRFHRRYFCHTFKTIFPAAVYGAEHPDFFPLIDGKRRVADDGQLCLSNPELVPLAIEIILQAIEEDPEAQLIGISQNDCKFFCQCEACQRLITAEGSPSGLVLHFVNQVAAGIAEVYPDKKVGTLAYMESFAPPATIRPAKNVVILLCTDVHTGSNPFLLVDETARFASAMRQWHALGAKIYIWDYVVDFLNYPRPYPNLAIMDHAIDFYCANGATGVMTQGNYTVENCSSFGALKAWCVAKKLWDPARKLSELAREFIVLHYGAAAPKMQEYLDLQEAEWRRFHADAVEGDLFVFSDGFIAQSRSLLGEAAALAGDDPELARRIALERFCVDYQYAYDGLKSADALPEYLANLETIQQFLHNNDMTSVSELGNYGPLFEQWRGNAEMAARPAYSPNAIKPIPNTTVFTNFPVLTVDAPELAEGSALRQPGGNSDWSIQIAAANFSSRLKPGREYVVMMPVKMEYQGAPPASGTPLFVLGQHNPVHGGNSFVCTLPAGAGTDGFHALVLGVYRATTRRSTSMLYLAIYPNAPVEAMQYGALQLIPLEEYRGVLPSALSREMLY